MKDIQNTNLTKEERKELSFKRKKGALIGVAVLLGIIIIVEIIFIIVSIL